MSAVAFFNNKGGVGKTTLACNIAAHLSRLGQRVLLIDCDPQCNSTQLILDADLCDRLYADENPPAESIADVVRPIEFGDASINHSVKPLAAADNRFGIDLVPGHPRLSVLEDQLSQAWTETMGRQIGGFRKTTWASSMLSAHAGHYDVVFFDLGPSLGSLNRTILLGSDYFVTPMGCDTFSIVGIRNIADWLSQWLKVYEPALAEGLESNAAAFEQFGIPSEVRLRQSFAGYTVQQYITKSKSGQRRPTAAFEAILKRIPEEVEATLAGFVADGLNHDSLKLGDVPSMFSLVPLSQSANAPIIELRSTDGLVGSQFSQQAKYVETIDLVTRALGTNIGLSLSA